jgi:hypothetical protein
VIERCLAIQKILEQVENEDLALTTTGMVSREAFVANDRPGNFYMLGSLGLLSSLGWDWPCSDPNGGSLCWRATAAP